MFIETYYDDRATVPGSTSEPMIHYPELSGEELERCGANTCRSEDKYEISTHGSIGRLFLAP
jgi:hypothetical protein